MTQVPEETKAKILATYYKTQLLGYRLRAEEQVWCVLLDPRCVGQVGLAKEVTPHGLRIKGVGVVPHDEYRLATESEISDFLAS